MKNLLRKFLEHPLTRGLDLDDPRTSELRKKIISKKGLLKKIYSEWHDLLLKDIAVAGPVLELGSGAAAFAAACRARFPGRPVIASDVLPLTGLDAVLDARRLPFRTGSLAAIAMTNVFHHIPDCAAFFAEADRCLKPGGVVTMIEPWNTPWANFVYRHLHHEPFEPESGAWAISGGGGAPLTRANDALAWIVLKRDRKHFQKLFPRLEITGTAPLMPLVYLLSGGVGMRSFCPGGAYGLIRFFERALPPGFCAMFAHIVIRRKA